MARANDLFKVSEQRLCDIFGVHRSSMHYVRRDVGDEARLLSDMHCLAQQYPRYGHRRICALLRGAGWGRNRKGYYFIV